MKTNFTLLAALAVLCCFASPVFAMDEFQAIGSLLQDEDAAHKEQCDHETMMQEFFNEFENRISAFDVKSTTADTAPENYEEAQNSFEHAFDLVKHPRNPSPEEIREANLSFLWSALNFLSIASCHANNPGFILLTDEGESDQTACFRKMSEAYKQIQSPDKFCQTFIGKFKHLEDLLHQHKMM